MTSGGRISLRRPSAVAIAAFLTAERDLPLSYLRPAAGVASPPPGFAVDARRVAVGHGNSDFAAACDALRRWQAHDLGWTEAVPATTPLAVGEVVAIVARLGPLWWTNAARIVEVIDEPGPPRRFGFAYGTLPAHAASGEERFLVEELDDGSVWYDLRAFSRPQSLLARLAYPAARALQRRFGTGSAAAMVRAVARACSAPRNILGSAGGTP